MENLAVLAFLFIVVVLAMVIGVAYWVDSLADRHDRADG